MTQFQTGKTYATRSACDYNCIFSFEVIARTAKRLTMRQGGKTFQRGIYIYNGIEKCKPLGTYSMCPVISADKDQVATHVDDSELTALRLANVGKTPSEWAKENSDGFYDISYLIGSLRSKDPLGRVHPYPMYSFNTPGNAFWNGVAQSLHDAGWSDLEILCLFQSSIVRHDFDATDDLISKLGKQFGEMWNKYLPDVREMQSENRSETKETA